MALRQWPVFALIAHSFLCPAAWAQDHLEPEEGAFSKPQWEWDYHERVRDVLLKDAASDHIARMIYLPSFKPEWVVTVAEDSDPDDDTPTTYYVEYVVAERELFPVADKQGPPPVRRFRAPLDRATAKALNVAWRKMLRKTHYPDEPRLGADGADYHFSRFVPLVNRGQNDPLAGFEQGTIWSPDDESLCGALVELGYTLKRYAEARPQDRDKIRAQINQQSAKLAKRLDTAAPARPAGA